MRMIGLVVLALFLLTVQSVVLQSVGALSLRVEFTVMIVAFLSLRATRGEGATCAFALGYLLDLMSGRPTGLYAFLAVLIFLIGRGFSSIVDIRTPVAFALFVAAADTVHGLLAAAFMGLTLKGPGAAALISALPGQVLLTGLASLLLFPLLRRLDPGTDRPQVGSLR